MQQKTNSQQKPYLASVFRATEGMHLPARIWWSARSLINSKKALAHKMRARAVKIESGSTLLDKLSVGTHIFVHRHNHGGVQRLRRAASVLSEGLQ